MLARYAKGPGFESRSGLVLPNPPPPPPTPPPPPHPTPLTFGGSVWVCTQTASSKGKSRQVGTCMGPSRLGEKNYFTKGQLYTMLLHTQFQGHQSVGSGGEDL